MKDDVPCRVSAELRQHLDQAERAQRREFDPWNDSIMSDICGAHLKLPIQSLMFTLIQIRNVERSFGLSERDKLRAYEALRHTLDHLEESCRDAYNDL